jgi:hypothetical protein
VWICRGAVECAAAGIEINSSALEDVMKKLLPVAAAVLLLAGCATVRDSSSGYRDNTDYKKVYLVEKWSRRNGVQVIWVNYPMKTRGSI